MLCCWLDSAIDDWQEAATPAMTDCTKGSPVALLVYVEREETEFRACRAEMW